MARNIPTAVQTLLNQEFGPEIVTVLQFYWGGDVNGPSVFYGDKKLDLPLTVQGKILNAPEVDEAVQVTGSGQASEFAVQLDDTDGSIKTEFDRNDVHKIPVRAWYYALGTDFDSEAIPYFLGQVNSGQIPISYGDGQKVFEVSVINRIEDIAVGFSFEESALPNVPEELIGQPVPINFGTTINAPSLKAVPAVSGRLLGSGVGIKDFTLQERINLAEVITCPQTPIGFKCFTQVAGAVSYKAVCNMAFEEDVACLQAKCVELEKLLKRLEEESAYEYPVIEIDGGQNMPQGREITLDIQGGLFTGIFNGTRVDPVSQFTIRTRQHPLFDPATGGLMTEDGQEEIESECPSAADDSQDSDFTQTAFGPVFTGMRESRIRWEAYRAVQAAGFFWAQGGSTVTLVDRQEIIHIANLIPSTILRVAAWRTINGNRFLLTVPDKYFSVRQTNYNGYNMMEIVFKRPLSSEDQQSGGGWTDSIFVTQVSSVGPNTVDIIEWFIDTYTSYAKDTTSFADVKAKLENYPMNFLLDRRPNIIQMLRDLARLNRCALWMKNDTFFIKYLAETPTPVATITNDDILVDQETRLSTLTLTLTKTTDLVTELTTPWKKDYALEKDNKLILRHNVSQIIPDTNPVQTRIKYGVHKREDRYFPFGHLDLVRKTATFWLIRWANTWKKVQCELSLEFLKLEPFDAMTVDLPQAADVPVTGVVERAALDTQSKRMRVTIWLPVRAGEMLPYDFAYPADIVENATFPNNDALNLRQAGSGADPNFSVFAPPGHPLETNTTGVYTGIQLGCNGVGVISLKPGECRQDHGDGQPSDEGDKKPTVNVNPDNSGGVSAGTAPVSGGQGNGYWGWNYDGRNRSDKNASDGNKGREYAALNDDSADPNNTSNRSETFDIDRDELDKLPDPDDVNAPCEVVVTVTGFQTKEQGTRPICVPDDPANDPRVEVYVFDQRQAAEDFCTQLESNSNCGSVAPCNPCIGSCSIVGTCAESVEGPGGIIGFRSNKQDRSFIDPPASP